ncbi:MAG: RagB/SusD family nutrient uptake outer membrane protein [Marinilabiliaceae bacterium]
MKHLKHIAMAFLAWGAACLTASCDDLDQEPQTDTTSSNVYTSVENYRSVLAKIYSVLTLKGSDGNADLTTYKGENFMRCYFNLQDVCTDELVYSWMSGDNMTDINDLAWDSRDVWVSDTYYWLYYDITLCNEFIRNANERSGGFSASDKATIDEYVLEARFMRSLAYWQVLDLYRKGAMVTEANKAGAYVPPAADATGLFNYVESELKDIADKMPGRTEQEYGRAPRGAAYALLARLYLNAEVYGQPAHYTEAITYSQKVLDEGYSLHPAYAELFNADNDKRTDEIIFGIESDATTTVSWGASTYIVCGCASAYTDQDPATVGISSPWSMWRATSQTVKLFEDYSGDARAMFYTNGQSKEVTDADNQNQGYLFTKWTNLTDAGETASNTATYGVNTDFPLFRAAEAYLNIAEAVLRGGEGASESADSYVNKVRERAGVSPLSGVKLDDVLDERGREFLLECQRRTDLIRFGKFIIGGWDCGPTNRPEKYKYYPIPQTELTANPNLTNPEY